MARIAVDYYRTPAEQRNKEITHTFFIKADSARDALAKLSPAIEKYRGVWVAHKTEAEALDDNREKWGKRHYIVFNKNGEQEYTIEPGDPTRKFKYREQACKYIEILEGKEEEMENAL